MPLNYLEYPAVSHVFSAGQLPQTVNQPEILTTTGSKSTIIDLQLGAYYAVKHSFNCF